MDQVEDHVVRWSLARRLGCPGPVPGETLLQPLERQPVSFPRHQWCRVKNPATVCLSICVRLLRQSEALGR
ncbi:hypothetical protein [Streptomyces sp. NPDC003480]